ncbi:oxidoreductase, aldo/keto reductase family protein [Listeria monocytogenes SHL010]|nr:oxidoreductase, aldo/keto reductase family protein [Listeria monocytogenes SHL010]
MPIPGTTKQSRIKENIASTDIRFDDGARQKIADALSQIEIVGDRYSAAENKRIGK